jgi:hypothetical protein
MTLYRLDCKIDLLAAECDALSAPPGTNPTARELLRRHLALQALVRRKCELENRREIYASAQATVTYCRDQLRLGRGNRHALQARLAEAQDLIEAIDQEML